MSPDNAGTDNRDNRILSLTAFILFLVGFFIPFICFWTPLPVFIFGALGAELFALIFGLMSWRLKLGRIAAIGAGLIWLVSIVNLIRFFHYVPHHGV